MKHINQDRPLMHLFMHIGKLMNERLRKELGKAGIHFGQARVLTALLQHDQLSQRMIGQGLDIKPATVTNMVKKMESSGLIHRQRDENDDRTLIVSLTGKGKKAAEYALAVMEQIEDHIRLELDPKEIETLRNPLERIRNVLGGSDPQI